MFAYANYLSVEVIVDFDIRFSVDIEPGLWVVPEGNLEYSVTSLIGCVVSRQNTIRLMYPKGVRRRPSGAWGAKEHVLVDFRHWHLVPDEVRAVIDEAYTQRRSALPDSLGALP